MCCSFVNHAENKRSREYNFGIGKRDDELNDQLVNAIVERLVKLMPNGFYLPYNDGLYENEANSVPIGNKRSKIPQRFSFGLGKRGPQRYQFGIGKRSIWQAFSSPNIKSFAENDRISNFDEFMKRRYSFGLGK